MKAVACAVALAFGASPLGAEAAVVRTGKANSTSTATSSKGKAGAATVIEPELDPETHKEWEKDYPIDVSHRLPLKLEYPYPAVQGASTFDKDYVKDENNNKMDKKAWDEDLAYGKAVSDAAEEVDKLKNKLRDLEKELAEAKDKQEEEEEEYEKAKKKEDALPPAPDGFKAENLGNASGDAVNISTEEVEKEMSDLEKCKEELRKAKEALAKLHEEAEAAHRVEEEKEDIKNKAEAFEKEADALHAKTVEKVDEEKGEYDKAVKTHAEEVAILEKMEADLKQAEEKLRSFRGGEKPDPSAQSGASMTRSTVLASVVVIVSYLYTSSA